MGTFKIRTFDSFVNESMHNSDSSIMTVDSNQLKEMVVRYYQDISSGKKTKPLLVMASPSSGADGIIAGAANSLDVEFLPAKAHLMDHEAIRLLLDMIDYNVVNLTTRIDVGGLPEEGGILYISQIERNDQILKTLLKLALYGSSDDYTLPEKWVLVLSTQRESSSDMVTSLMDRFQVVNLAY